MTPQERAEKIVDGWSSYPSKYISDATGSLKKMIAAQCIGDMEADK